MQAEEHDPVCGMKVDPTRAAASMEYQGATVHFCSKGQTGCSANAPAGDSRAVDLANGLKWPGVHAAVSTPILPSTSVQAEKANPATESAPEPRNQRIEC